MPALPTPAIASANTLLYLGTDASPSIFSDYIGRLGNIDFAGVAIDVQDVSNQESVAHRTLATLLKSGDLNAMLFWEPGQTQDDELFDLIIAAPPVLRSWKVEWPTGVNWLFSGWLTKFASKADIGKELNATLTISIDDGITVT